jgi:hypothetical protein
MQRSELYLNDAQLIEAIRTGYGIQVQALKFIGIGYSFIIECAHYKKYFLKVYPVNKQINKFNAGSAEQINQQGNILHRLRREFGLTNISSIIPTSLNKFFFEINGFRLVLSDYIEGSNPSYEPNTLHANALAHILSNLHSMPINAFSELPKEQFNIDQAVGFAHWLDNESADKEIVDVIKKHESVIKEKLQLLKTWAQCYKNQHPDFVITHGDPHHFNVLQNEKDVYLIDWDNVELAPREHDLWFYENAPLMNYYSALNPEFKLDHDLCRYYQLQRMFEDFRYYLEDECSTEAQRTENKKIFLNHWGWNVCLG